VKKRVLIAEPDADVRSMLAVAVARLGHEPVYTGEADAVLLEPACLVAQDQVQPDRPVVCFSIYPEERGLAPAGTVAYLQKPASSASLGAALRIAFGS
jgi:hypothetical protein